MRRLTLFAASLLVACGGCDDLGDPVHVDCGNGVVDALEVCDGVELAGQTCASQGFERGNLACSPSCGGFVVASCEGVRGDISPCALCAVWESCIDARCVATCDGEPFSSDTSLQFDITTVRVSGRVTVDGAPPTFASTLQFVGEVFWAPAVVDVAADGSFATSLEPGGYEVTWQSRDEAFVASERLADLEVTENVDLDLALTPWQELELPVSTDFPGEAGAVIYEHLDPRFGRVRQSIDASGPLRLRDGEYRLWWAHTVDEFPAIEFFHQTNLAELAERGEVDLPVVEVALAISMNGAPVQAETGVRAELVRTDEVPRPGWLSISRDRERWELDADGRATGWLLDRPRDVAVVINGPPMWGWVWAQRDVELTGELDFDIAAPRVAGEVLRNGGRLPNSGVQGVMRGRLEFTGDAGSLTIELGDRGRGEFAVRLPRGLWAVQLTGSLFAGALPLTPWDAPDLLSVVDDTDDVELDVPAVRLAGQLTVNGLRPPDDLELETRGALQLRERGTSTWFTVPIPPRGPAGWDVIVTPGTYDTELVRWWFASSGEDAPPGVLPLGTWSLGEVDASAATRYDVDVQLHEVTIAIESHGESAEPGLLWFEDLRAERLAREADTAADPLTVTLYPGYYRVVWAPYVDDSAVGPVVLDHALIVDGPLQRTYDVGRVSIEGAISVNGEPVEDANGVGVHLTRRPSANTTTTVATSSSGPTTFSTELVPGYVDIVLGASAHDQLPPHGTYLHRACH